MTELLLDQVDVEPAAANTPEHFGQVAAIARNIAEVGLLQPIIVERKSNGRYAMIAGHLRLAACQKLGWKMIPGIVREPAPLGISSADLRADTLAAQIEP